MYVYIEFEHKMDCLSMIIQLVHAQNFELISNKSKH